MKEDHPLAFNLTFSVSLGLLPISLSLRATGCGIRKSEFPGLELGDMEIGSKGFPLLSLFQSYITIWQ